MQEDSPVIGKMAKKVTLLRQEGITLIDVMMVKLSQGIQSLQDRAHLMWEYNGVDDSARAIRGGFYEGWSLRDLLSSIFKARCLTSPMNLGASVLLPTIQFRR